MNLKKEAHVLGTLSQMYLSYVYLTTHTHTHTHILVKHIQYTYAHIHKHTHTHTNTHTQVEAMVVVLGSVLVLGMCVATCLKTLLVYQVSLV